MDNQPLTNLSGTNAPHPQKEVRIDPNMLFVEVRNPDTRLYSGPAIAVSALNDIGPFDVLPAHENFISIIANKLIIFVDKKQKKEILLQKAVLKAKNNKVEVFIGIETLGHEANQVVTNLGATPIKQ